MIGNRQDRAAGPGGARELGEVALVGQDQTGPDASSRAGDPSRGAARCRRRQWRRCRKHATIARTHSGLFPISVSTVSPPGPLPPAALRRAARCHQRRHRMSIPGGRRRGRAPRARGAQAARHRRCRARSSLGESATMPASDPVGRSPVAAPRGALFVGGQLMLAAVLVPVLRGVGERRAAAGGRAPVRARRRWRRSSS